MRAAFCVGCSSDDSRVRIRRGFIATSHGNLYFGTWHERCMSSSEELCGVAHSQNTGKSNTGALGSRWPKREDHYVRLQCQNTQKCGRRRNLSLGGSSSGTSANILRSRLENDWLLGDFWRALLARVERQQRPEIFCPTRSRATNVVQRQKMDIGRGFPGPSARRQSD